MDANGSTMTYPDCISSPTMTIAGDEHGHAPAQAERPPHGHRPQAQQQPGRDPALRADQRPADRTDHRADHVALGSWKSTSCSTT